MRIFGCVCGQFHTEAQSFGMRSGGRMQAPVPFYVLEHPEGVTLFDCGLHANVGDADDPYRQALQAVLTPEPLPGCVGGCISNHSDADLLDRGRHADKAWP